MLFSTFTLSFCAVIILIMLVTNLILLHTTTTTVCETDSEISNEPEVILVPEGRFVWPEEEAQENNTKAEAEGLGNPEETVAQPQGNRGEEGVCFGPWSELEGFPLFRDYQFPPHWTGFNPTRQNKAKQWVLPGRYGLGTYTMKRFVEDWIIMDTVMSRYPKGPWPQLLGMSADRVVHAIRNRCLYLGLTEVPVCLLADDGPHQEERPTCSVHTRCVVVHQFQGRVSRVPLSTTWQNETTVFCGECTRRNLVADLSFPFLMLLRRT